jgi:transposase
MDTKVIDFSGTNIYAGVDVHKKSWHVTILTDEMEHRTFSQPPNPLVLSNYLHKHFPRANYYSAYEAGFSGYSHHRELLNQGIQNIVVNAADVPNTNKELTTKTDKVDSRKIAKGLRSKMLHSIHVFDRVHEEYRNLSRQRHILQRDLRRYKQRIKSFLLYYNLHIPDDIDAGSWNLDLEAWLKAIKMETENGQVVLTNLLDGYLFHKQQVRSLSNELRRRTRKQHKQDYYLLRSIPGIGPLTAITIIAEIKDMQRFSSIDKLSSFVGLMPMSHSSGQREHVGGITYRSNTYLRTMVIESSWQAIRLDPAMLYYYKKHLGRGNSKKAIVKVARKLLSRIRYVMINKEPYEIGIK